MTDRVSLYWRIRCRRSKRPSKPAKSIVGDDQEPGGQPGHRRHTRRRLDPGAYPGAVQDPDTGQWISDAEVAETTYTAFAATTDHHRPAGRPAGQRPPPPGRTFPVWRYHPFFTNSDLPTAKPTSSTAATPSSKPCSPTSSTDPWPTNPPGTSAPTRPGQCGRHRPQPAPRRRHPRRPPPTRWPAARPCADGSSTSPPDPPDPPAARPAPTHPPPPPRAVDPTVGQRVARNTDNPPRPETIHPAENAATQGTPHTLAPAGRSTTSLPESAIKSPTITPTRSSSRRVH